MVDSTPAGQPGASLPLWQGLLGGSLAELVEGLPDVFPQGNCGACRRAATSSTLWSSSSARARRDCGRGGAEGLSEAVAGLAQCGRSAVSAAQGCTEELLSGATGAVDRLWGLLVDAVEPALRVAVQPEAAPAEKKGRQEAAEAEGCAEQSTGRQLVLLGDGLPHTCGAWAPLPAPTLGLRQHLVAPALLQLCPEMQARGGRERSSLRLGVSALLLSIAPAGCDGPHAPPLLLCALPPAAAALLAGLRGACADGQEQLGVLFPGYFEGFFLMTATAAQCLGFLATYLVPPHQIPPPCALYSLGAAWGPGIAAGELWRLVAPLVLHAGTFHLLSNTMFQLSLGFNLERHFGSLRFGALYLATGIFGNVVSAAVDPLKLAVGSSTSGWGMVGADLALIAVSWANGEPVQRHHVWFVYLGVVFAGGLFFGGSTDFYGHLGGCLSGFCLTLTMEPACPKGVQAAALTVLSGIGLVACWQLHHVAPMPLDCPPIMWAHEAA